MSSSRGSWKIILPGCVLREKIFRVDVDRDKRIWYLSPMRAAKVQASLRICAVSPEPSLLAHISSESRGTFRQKARSLVPLNGWACAVKICHDGMLEDTNSLDGAQMRQINVLHEPDFSSDSESETIPLFIASVGKQENSDWYSDMLLKNQVVNLKLNSGAQCNVLPYSLFKKVGGIRLWIATFENWLRSQEKKLKWWEEPCFIVNIRTGSMF